MPLDDDNILRWLNRANDGEPLRLDGIPPEGASEAELEAWRRLAWVQGILGTLDHRMAPEELDRLVAEGELRHERDQALGLQSWAASVHLDALSAGEPDEWLDPMIAPSRAPEFLDRIVEQRLSAIEAQLQTARARRQRTRSVRVGSLTLTGILAGALALALIPWGHWRASAAPSPIHIVQYSSLNGLTSAHPDQAQFATLVGDFGAFVESPSTDGGVR